MSDAARAGLSVKEEHGFENVQTSDAYSVAATRICDGDMYRPSSVMVASSEVLVVWKDCCYGRMVLNESK